MKRKQYFMILITSILLSANFSCIKQKSYIKNKALEKQIEIFINADKANYPSDINKPETITIVFKKKYNYYFVSFNYYLLTGNPKLYAIIEAKNRTVFIISDTDISDFVFCSKPYTVNDLKFKKANMPNMIVDWYYDYLYFNGKIFSHKESDMNK